MYLVLIETSGNQNYIFATNKLRENVGASELTYRAGTEWVLTEVQKITGKSLWSENAATVRENLCRPDLNPPITDSNTLVEVITATSGKALLLVNDGKVGRCLIRNVTNKALREAPGLDTCGVISNEFDWEKKSLGEVNKQLHEKTFEQVRANRPGPALRFLRLPVIEDCRSSGLPAACWDDLDKNDQAARSNVSLAKRKREWQKQYRRRLYWMLGMRKWLIRFAKNINVLEKHCDWLAVVHADGNGLGEIFLNFAEHVQCDAPDIGTKNKAYVDQCRRFSLALDVCTQEAFKTALSNLIQRHPQSWFKLPVLPIVLGGDDLTVVCDGRVALQLTYDFLQEFENQTKNDTGPFDGIIPQIVRRAFTAKRLSACAGIAIVKPHFPFSAAYDLAEELIVSAKRVKKLVTDPNKSTDDQKTPWPCSSLDFHALYDSSSSELDTIRGKLRYRIPSEEEPKCEIRNYARPYVVTPLADLNGATGKDWAERHHWEQLANQVEAILAPEKDSSGQETGRRNLPNSQLHELRAGLPLKKDIADGRFKLIKQRYGDLSLFKGENAETLYHIELVDKAEAKDEDGNKVELETEFTTLLDAMDAANFWRKEDAK